MASGRLRVFFISRDFSPVQHSGTLRAEAFARYLPEFGIDPIILTSSVTDSESVVGLDKHRMAAWSDDPRWLAVHRIIWNGQGTRNRLDRWLRRIPVLAELAERRQLHSCVDKLLPAATEAVQHDGAALIYASAPPFETVALAVRLGRARRLPVVADLRDLRTHNPSPPYRHWVDFKLAVRREAGTLRECARVIVNTKLAAQIVGEEFRVPKERIELLYNGYDERDFGGVATREPLEPGRFVVVHAGQLASGSTVAPSARQTMKRFLGFDYDPLSCDFNARSPRYVLAALRRLVEEAPELRERIRIWFVGMNEPEASEPIQRFPYPECLRILGRVDSHEAMEICCRADLLLLMQFQFFRQQQHCCIAIPAKLFSYLRSGNRILALVQPSEIADLVQEHDAGIVAPPTNVAAIKDALWREFERWRDAGRSAWTAAPRPGIERFERRALTGRLAQILRDVASPVPRPPARQQPVCSYS